MITTLFNKYNFNIANLYRFSHLQPFRLLFGSFMGTGWNFTRARIFSSLFISLLPRDSNWQKRKEKKREITRRRRKKERKKEWMKEKRGGKRKRGKRKKIFFHIFLPSFMQGEWITEAEGSEAWKVATILLACFSVLHVTVTRRFQFNF